MECDEVGDRLVALHDDELSASEALQVREHLGTCSACTRRERRLVTALPTPPSWGPPDALRARLVQQLDPALLLALAERPEAEPRRRSAPLSVVWRPLTHVASVPVGAVIVYLALLAASFGWGVSNWWTVSALRAPQGTSAETVRIDGESPSGTAIPADQFRPAAWDPSADPAGEPSLRSASPDPGDED